MSQTISLKSRLSPRRTLIDGAFRFFLYLSIFISLGMIFWIVSSLWNEAGWLLSWDLLTKYPSYDIDNAGFQSPLVGSLWVVGIATLVALPTGLLTALYLEEFAGKGNKFSRLIELNIQNLAGVPAVVFGLIGLAFIVRGFVKWGFTVGSAAAVIAMLMLPVIIIVSREAIRAVPPSYREGALALGATPWQAVWRLVLPSAIPGTATGSILAVSRAIGRISRYWRIGSATSPWRTLIRNIQSDWT